jgi:hypothetical protein
MNDTLRAELQFVPLEPGGDFLAIHATSVSRIRSGGR